MFYIWWGSYSHAIVIAMHPVVFASRFSLWLYLLVLLLFIAGISYAFVLIIGDRFSVTAEWCLNINIYTVNTISLVIHCIWSRSMSLFPRRIPIIKNIHLFQKRKRSLWPESIMISVHANNDVKLVSLCHANETRHVWYS